MNPPTRYTDVLAAALTGGEDDIRRALERLDESSLSRLRNALRNVAVLRFLLATRHLTEYQVGVLFDRVVTETELMDLDVTVRRSVR